MEEVKPRQALEKYLANEIDFMKLWYWLMEDPDCQLGAEGLNMYDTVKGLMQRGRPVPEDMENDFRERMQSLLRREGWK